MEAKFPFNVRVYGILRNDRNELLISDEFEHERSFSKFPGGGLEYGEGLRDGLKREFLEECNAEVSVGAHLYTTDFFVKSAFGPGQVISVYYQVELLQPLRLKFQTKPFDFSGQSGPVKQSFRWVPMPELRPEELTFPIDRYVVELIRKNPDKLL